MGIPKDSVAGRREFERSTEERRKQGGPKEWKAVRRGWCYGSEEFRRELLEQMEGKLGPDHGGIERQESAEERARKLIARELKRRGWDRSELERRKKGDRAKAQIAQRLRRETTMTWDWIARGPFMGASGYAANCVRSFLSSA